MESKITPEEATAMYNIAKIKFDPTSYSLKGNLILDLAESVLRTEHISSFSDNALNDMLDAISKKEHRDYEKSFKSAFVTDRIQYSRTGVFCIQQDNLYICKKTLDTLFPRYSNSPRIIQAIAMLCVALNSAKSCSKCMAWFAIPGFELLDYESLYNLQYLRDQLCDKSQQLSVFKRTSLCVSYLPEAYEGRAPAYEEGFCESMYGAYFFAFEVMWAINALPVEFRDVIKQLIQSSSHTDTYEAFFNPYINVTATDICLSTDLEAAIAITSPKERFKAYQEIVKKEAPAVPTAIDDYRTTVSSKPMGLNFMLCAFASFVGQLSITHIRINTIRIIYEYCKVNKCLPNIDRSAFSPFMKYASSIGGSEAERDLFRLDSEEDHTLKCDEEYEEEDEESVDIESSHSDDTPLFEALDLIKSSFKAGRYRFDVQDVIDVSPRSSAKYKAISDKVALVNKLLIRRIKAIKTYNVGGKNPGQSSGKLDRKVLYRYKYDPNIFYNNTYKVLESDLAFGVILDESGSMSGKGIANGRIAMVVLHETFKALGINHSIIGHTSNGKYHSEITRYQAFKEDKTYTVCKNYALISTEAKSGNCDSGALYYMEKAFSRVRNKDKICLIFSDGAPTECTGTDLKNQVAAMERAGIKVIGIGINFPSIAKYYKSYANGRNLTDMLNIISRILEEYVLKKKVR